MKLQVTAELASQQGVCCFASIRNFPFWTFLLPTESGGRTQEKNLIKVSEGGIDPVRPQGRLGPRVVSELKASANVALEFPPKKKKSKKKKGAEARKMSPGITQKNRHE